MSPISMSRNVAEPRSLTENPLPPPTQPLPSNSSSKNSARSPNLRASALKSHSPQPPSPATTPNPHNRNHFHKIGLVPSKCLRYHRRRRSPVKLLPISVS